jgi:nucleoside-diphosphate-sugar epimerase
MNLNFDKVLVTGGAGFIGSHIVDTLIEKGCKVTVLDNLSTGKLSNLEHVREKITFIKGDIEDLDVLRQATKNCDVVFHEAALVSVPQSVQEPIKSAMINDIGTLNMFEAARENHVKRVVFACSSAVYGDDPEVPKHEQMRPKPMSPYAVQKLTGEYYAQIYFDLYGVEAVSLRYFNVYGPRQDPSSPYSGVISIFMSRANQEKAPVIYGDGKQTRDFVFVKDVVWANLLAASAEGIGKEVFNVGIGSSTSINELWKTICDMAELNISPQYGPERPGDILESVSNIDRIQKRLGFNPQYSFEKGLKITFDWYKTEK